MAIKRGRKMKWKTLVIIFVMLISIVCHAAEIKKAQGTVFLVNNNTVLVGERVFVCNENTQILNEQGAVIILNNVRVKDSVSIESVTEQGKNIALKISILKRGI
jgi:hypothetical protein